MDRQRLQALLASVKAGATPVDAAVEELAGLPFADRGYARVDTHRALRLGLPEVIFGVGKTAAQVLGIASELLARGQRVVVTRVSEETAAAVRAALPRAEFRPVARCLVVDPEPPPAPREPVGRIALLTAGTSDIPVAEEARVVCEAFGNRVDALYDVGVAGIHRVLEARDRLLAARVVIVVAGMEGALASVVAGMVPRPVIAVPTSVGYGASFGGIAALLSMLNSCAGGVSVVNIDNGFGAAWVATLVNRGAEPAPGAGAGP
jgi:NCAIR mutase (PurE)-related protein